MCKEPHEYLIGIALGLAMLSERQFFYAGRGQKEPLRTRVTRIIVEAIREGRMTPYWDDLWESAN